MNPILVRGQLRPAPQMRAVENRRQGLPLDPTKALGRPIRPFLSAITVRRLRLRLPLFAQRVSRR